MAKKRKKNSAYQTAVIGAKSVLRLLIYICVILGIIFAGKAAYSFGYLIFDQHPMAETAEEGQDVTVIVKEDDSVYKVGETLKSKGLIERPEIFWMQEKLSDFRGKIQPGTYILNTCETVDEMLAILSGENTEGQPSPTEGTENTESDSQEGSEE